MRAKLLKDLIELAGNQTHPISKAITESVEVGVVVPSILRAKLEALGLTLVKNPGRQFQHVVQIDVIDKRGPKPLLVASGTSGDEADALLHAALGYVRERRIDELVAGGMSKAEAVKTAVVN